MNVCVAVSLYECNVMSPAAQVNYPCCHRDTMTFVTHPLAIFDGLVQPLLTVGNSFELVF